LVGQLYAPWISAGESPNGEEAPGPVARAKQVAPVVDPFEHERLDAVAVVALTPKGVAEARTAVGRQARPKSQPRRHQLFP